MLAKVFRFGQSYYANRDKAEQAARAALMDVARAAFLNTARSRSQTNEIQFKRVLDEVSGRLDITVDLGKINLVATIQQVDIIV